MDKFLASATFPPKMDWGALEGMFAVADLGKLPGTLTVGNRRDGARGRIGIPVADADASVAALEDVAISEDWDEVGVDVFEAVFARNLRRLSAASLPSIVVVESSG